MKEREVTKNELKKLQAQQKRLIKIRGEIIHWVVEIEAILDEIICGHFIKGEYFSKFMEILSWKNFPFALKIRLFNEIYLAKSFEKRKKEIVANLENLNRIRNKIAHRMGIVSLKDKYIGDIRVDEKFINKVREKAKDTLASLKAILYYWAGLKPDDIKKTRIKWIKINKIKGHFLERES